jgi:predicted amidohydrolase
LFNPTSFGRIAKPTEKVFGDASKLEQTHLIVFPEMFTTGFSMNPEKLKEKMDGPSVQWMKTLAKEKMQQLPEVSSLKKWQII